MVYGLYYSGNQQGCLLLKNKNKIPHARDLFAGLFTSHRRQTVAGNLYWGKNEMQIRSKAELYRMFPEKVLYIRSGPKLFEPNPTPALFAPVNAFGRLYRPGVSEGVWEFETHMAQVLGLKGNRTVFLRPNSDVGVLVRECLEGANIEAAVFEGYSVDSKAEGADVIEALRLEVGTELSLIASLFPEMVDKWNGKRHLRQRARFCLGEGSVAFGREYDGPPSLNEMQAFIIQARERGVREVIFKTPGTSGQGSLILPVTGKNDNELLGFVLRHREAPWWVAEGWKPWIASFGVSFFIPDSETCIPLTICRQILSGATFLGCHTLFEMDTHDREFIFQKAETLVREMQIDGIRGFVALDIIICNSNSKKEEGLVLPISGKSLVFVEANCRVTWSHQKRLFASHVARREGVESHQVVHLDCRISPVPEHIQTSIDVEDYFASKLKGLAVPFGKDLLIPGVAYFVVAALGEHKTIFDHITLFGLDSPETRQAIGSVYDQLKNTGTVKV